MKLFLVSWNFETHKYSLSSKCWETEALPWYACRKKTWEFLEATKEVPKVVLVDPFQVFQSRIRMGNRIRKIDADSLQDDGQNQGSYISYVLFQPSP